MKTGGVAGRPAAALPVPNFVTASFLLRGQALRSDLAAAPHRSTGSVDASGSPTNAPAVRREEALYFEQRDGDRRGVSNYHLNPKGEWMNTLTATRKSLDFRTDVARAIGNPAGWPKAGEKMIDPMARQRGVGLALQPVNTPEFGPYVPRPIFASSVAVVTAAPQPLLRTDLRLIFILPALIPPIRKSETAIKADGVPKHTVPPPQSRE